jgi:hypothetical protein
MSRQVAKLEREVHALAVAKTEVERIEAARRFQRRVERGDFGALLTGRFRELVQQAGQEGLMNAAGALQLAIVRLLVEEPDPAKMATALSKVANATAHVAKTQDGLARKLEEEERLIADTTKRLQRRRASFEEEYQQKLGVVLDAEEMQRGAEASMAEAETRASAAEARAADAERRWEEASGALAAHDRERYARPEARVRQDVDPATDPELAAFEAKYAAFRASRPGLSPEDIRRGQEAARRYAEEGMEGEGA